MDTHLLILTDSSKRPPSSTEAFNARGDVDTELSSATKKQILDTL